MHTLEKNEEDSVGVGPQTAKGPELKRTHDEEQIWTWNQVVPETVTACMHDLVTDRASKQPGEPAVCSWDGDLTYGTLEEFSISLATYLKGRGVGPEVLVPICFEKSKWVIVAMLAILKAGGGFVPIDHTQPAARIEYIVRQSKAKLILSSRSVETTWKGIVDDFCVVDEDLLASLSNDSSPSTSLTPKSVAYVIFTSGSTGDPKGVVVEHESLCTSSVIGGKALGFDSKPRTLQFSAYTFDVCILEIFATLVYGGCLCIPSEWDRMNDLVSSMDRMKVTCVVSTPALPANLRLEDVNTLSTLIIGGESTSLSLVRRLIPKVRLFLAYGPTEAVVVCLALDATRIPYTTGDIGRPTTGRAWIVEVGNSDVLAPVGKVGELLIEGSVVARGYLDEPAKTAAAFVKKPAWMPNHLQQNHKFYRTGDLVKYNEDGSIKFMGRMDNQVKIRGHRLELGEVEYQMQSLPTTDSDVKEIVAELVIPWHESASGVLAAFLLVDSNVADSFGYLNWKEIGPSTLIVPGMENQNLSIFVNKVKERLSLVLPAYAIPSIYLPVRRLPLTNSGKLDRKKLRRVASEFSRKQLVSLAATADSEPSASLDMPLSGVEQHLRELWAKVLMIEPATIGLQDNFLWLGGDSVSAIGLVATAREEGLLLTVGSILRKPVLADMALLVEHIERQQDSELLPFALVGHDVKDDLLKKASTQCEVAVELIEDIYPCSPMQRGLMALSLKEAGSYTMQSTFLLPPSVNLETFKAAWQTVSLASPALRTRFFEDGSSGLVQAVVKESIQWRLLKETTLASYLAEDKSDTMEIGGPLSRYALVENGGGDYHFVFSVHHSIIDAWALSHLLRRVEQAYCGRAQSNGTHFNKFIQYLSDFDEDPSRRFWAHQLIDAPAPAFPQLPSPTYRPRGNTSLTHEVHLERKSRSSITTATIVKAAWSLLIGLYSNTTDVVTGMTLNGRTAALLGIEEIIGPTLVTVPYRTQFRPDQPVIEMLERIQEQYIEMIPFEQLGLSDIKRAGKESAAACDFRTLLVIQSTDEANLHAESELFSSKNETTLSLDYGLALECELLSSTRLNLKATFDDHLLPKVQIQRIFYQFAAILHRLCLENPATRVSELQNACQADVKEIFHWNTTVPEPREECLHELIASRAQQSPEHPAICSWDGELTYGELEDHSSQLAKYLALHEGIGPEVLVPICFEKSKWAAVTMLSVLKAGGACVCLSPAHPIARLETIINDLGQRGSNLVLASPSNEHLFSGIKRVMVVSSDFFAALNTNGTSNGETPPAVKASPSNPAFVVFTSGSTGKPKGIVLEHRSVATSAREHGALIKLGAQSRVLQFSSFTFDISIGDIFVTLIYGGTVCIPSEHQRMNDLARAISTLKANHVSLTPTVANHLHPEDVMGLKVLVVMGEAMTREVMDRWANRVSLINMYGPAEASIYCIGQPDIQREDPPSIIGRGVGARVWITNEDDPNVLMPIGCVGEILLEGPLLARGYINDESNPAFVLDPAWVPKKSDNPPGRRFYRTGDLASYDPNGLLTFVGRKDDGQIKLRGQRVEAGEVEYQLRACLSHPVESVVSVIKVNGQAALAAFLELGAPQNSLPGLTNGNAKVGSQIHISKSPVQLDAFRSLTAGIETKLTSVLPSYMVPSLYIPISRIPLSLSGKVDRRKLQLMVEDLSFDQISSFRETKTNKASPSSRMEQQLAGLWGRILKVTDVGIEDNFFQRGGDSIAAMRLVAAARVEGLSLTVDAIFKNPTLSDMALITRANSIEEVKVLPFSLLEKQEVDRLCGEAITQCGVSKEEIQDIYPCTPQQAYWIDGGVYNHEHQVQAVNLMPDSVDLETFCAAWNTVISAHDILRTRIIRTSIGYFNVIVEGGLQWRTESSLEAYLDEDRKAIIGYGDPLQRLCIVNDAYLNQRYFVFSAQHSSYDAWSLYLLFKDRDYAYHNGNSTMASPNFNRYVKSVTGGSYIVAATKFWQSHLAGTVSKPLWDVPEGYKLFPDSLLKREFILPKPQGSSVTISTMIEVAWAIVFSRTLGEYDVVLDILRHGRNNPLPRVMNLSAPTMAAVPFRLHVDPQRKIRELLLWAHNQLGNMTAFEHMGFANISNISAEITEACKNSVRIHILPPLGDLQEDSGNVKGTEVSLLWAELCLALPFRVDLAVTNTGVGMEAQFDKNIVTPDQVDKYFRQFEATLLQVSVADENQRVEDISFSGFSTKDSVLTESLAGASLAVKRAVLTPPTQAPVEGPRTGSFVIGRW